MDTTVRVWDPESGKQVNQEFRGHAKWVLALAWQPYHREYHIAVPQTRISLC